MISIGGVIGTGLFLGSAEALYEGGPIGALLGYSIIGTVVYCLCVSIGEMIAFLPNVGGVVGLADLYVDPALGFSLGWASWYNWTITLPAEISAAALAMGYWSKGHTLPKIHQLIFLLFLSPLFAVLRDVVFDHASIQLFITTSINLLPSGYYGEVEFYFSSFKVGTIVLIIFFSLLSDVGVGRDGFLGLQHWHQPFPDSFLGVHGAKGRFLGFTAVLMQAAFSFFGSEVPGINVPRALRRVWIRITLFYVGGIFCAGLLVPWNQTDLTADTSNGFSSPFVIAFEGTKLAKLGNLINAAIVISAFSAASSDIYISSRYLFFLARQKHAPAIFAFLLRHPDTTASRRDPVEEEEGSDVEMLLTGRPKLLWALPFTCIMTATAVGTLAFLSGGTTASYAFKQLTAAASVSSLLSWTGMLFTYIRWHQGTAYAEKKNKGQDTEEAREVIEQIDKIKEHRHKGQPYLAWYAFIVCTTVLFTNGWTVFLHNNWRIADDVKPPDLDPDDIRVTTPVATFLASYIPLPLFVLLTLGYKMMYQTEMVTLDQMTFSRENVPELVEDELPPRNRWEKIVRMFI
ncbi:amino acid transporter [Laetiporus sulphureus 93-53]|uniref:Amino acid transporter n=1 Tax=Laetiporus sulphureus 93-53 TaxID=1314785 RepID=A0A165HVG3_9APHY|nr:amino acid transporter [Laetiporus sulphureus 93-53]KZT12242.1 amino acid transporter [Laetiporus sulphureus 93-53]